METITEMVRNLMVLLLLASFLELLLPAGDMARVARLAVGLCLLAALIAPLSGLLTRAEAGTNTPPGTLEDGASAQTYVEQGRELNAALQDIAAAYLPADEEASGGGP